MPARRLYFTNRWIDVTAIGGLSIATFVALSLLDTSEVRGSIMSAAFYGMWLCNWPHFSATSYRLYSSRANIAQFPVTALVVPVLLLAGVIWSMAEPAVVAPYLVKLFLLWSPYHFSGQTYGITLVYARRAGVQFERFEKKAMAAFIFSTFIYQTARFESATGLVSYFDIQYPALGLPPQFVMATEYWMYGTGAALLIALARKSLADGRMIHPMVLLPAVTQVFWFVLGANVALYYEFVPFFHSLQYLLIAWAMQLSETQQRLRVSPSRAYAVGESGRWGVINLLGGMVLFWALPRLLANASGMPLSTVEGIAIAGVQIHHFFVDGVIWKLRDARVSAPLMASLADVTGSRALAKSPA